MLEVVTWIILLILSHASALDLYGVLGISRGATTAEIKRSYRSKARDTHPDKQRGVDPEVSAKAFRLVVEAYEVLSDDSARREYDRTGRVPSSQTQKKDQDFRYGWSFTAGRASQGPRQHRFLFDRVRRVHIRDAQSRVINIRSLEQLWAVIVDDGNETMLTERYTFISFFDSMSTDCENILKNEILYPWPFAGYNYEGAPSGGMWWEEILVSTQVDLANGNQEGVRIAMRFGVPLGDTKRPTIVMIPRGISLSDAAGNHHILHAPKNAEAFMQWVWPLLRMNVYFVNKTPYVLQLYWLDGNRGKEQSQILAGNSYMLSTFISHSFFARASFVEGYSLTNESALMWYTARIEDDNKRIEIVSRCFDHHGDCVRWKREGFCDRSLKTVYTSRNPGHYDYVLSNCFVSCEIGCGRRVYSGGSHPEL